MKLNRGMLWATAATATMLVVGGVTVGVVGIDRPAESDPRFGIESAEAEQPTSADDATNQADSKDLTEQYRGGGSHGGGSRGGGAHSGGGHSFGHTGWGRGYGHAGGYGRGWGGRGWGGSRWGRWGGGRYVGGRWVGGPYYGWCDDRYYACDRAWW